MQGPMTAPRNTREKNMHCCLRGCSFHILYSCNLPWIEKKINLSQGKIGDLRWQDEKTGLYEVHFEDKDLKPYLVKESNINILFELLNE